MNYKVCAALLLSAAVAAVGCRQLGLSSRFEKHFGPVRAAARDLNEAATRHPFDLEFAREKPMKLQLALAQAEAAIRNDPALDADYRQRAMQLLEMYAALTRLGFQSLRAELQRDPRQRNPYLDTFGEALRNTEAGYFDRWESVSQIPQLR